MPYLLNVEFDLLCTPLDSLKWHRAATYLSIISIQSLSYESFQFEKFIHFFSPVAYYSDKAERIEIREP